MSRTVNIEIFPIAKTKVDRQAVRRWLDHLEANDYEIPSEEASTDPSLLIALAAKRCYKSFTVGLNPNVTRIRKDLTEYLDNVLKSGHGCYDAETDVLTKDGWKSWEDVTELDYFATRTESGQLEYHRPTRLIKYHHTGKMYRVSAQACDLLVTPDHKMLACKMTTADGRKKEKYSLIKAEELGKSQHAYVRSAEWKAGTQDISAEWAALLGFAIGDGCYKGGNQVHFHLRRERKISWLINQARLAGATLTTKEDGETYVLDASDHLQFFNSIYTENGSKQIPPGFICTQNSEILQSLFNGLMQADGSVCEDGRIYDTTSQILAGQFQQLCLHIGIAANISNAPSCLDRSKSFGDKRIYRMQIGRRSLKPEVNKPGLDGSTSWVEDWEGDVFCAEVPNHTLFVRRNGKVVWSGNSVCEHATYTFAIEGVSRVFTGEMNRHRAGVGISEASMRYIRYTDIPYWLPDSVRVQDGDDESLREKKLRSQAVFQKAFDQDEANYQELQDIWSKELSPEGNFTGKKHITSMMRRIIPMGVATGGVWTMNLRAVRHIIALRASPAAEEEILHVFCRIAKYMIESEPMLCGDFTETPEGFFVPRYLKV